MLFLRKPNTKTNTNKFVVKIRIKNQEEESKTFSFHLILLIYKVYYLVMSPAFFWLKQHKVYVSLIKFTISGVEMAQSSNLQSDVPWNPFLGPSFTPKKFFRHLHIKYLKCLEILFVLEELKVVSRRSPFEKVSSWTNKKWHNSIYNLIKS